MLHLLSLKDLPKKINIDYEYIKYLMLLSKRYMVELTMIFIFQYSCIFFISTKVLVPPFNATLGLAFALFYIRGARVFPGILLALLCAYILAGYSFSQIIFVTMLYMFLGLIGAHWAHRFIRSDVMPFADLKVLKRFFFLAMTLGGISTICKIAMGDNNGSAWNEVLETWCSDINGILIFGGYLLSMAYLPHISSIVKFSSTAIVQGVMHLLFFASLIMLYSSGYFYTVALCYVVLAIMFFKRANIIVLITSMSIFCTIVQAYTFINKPGVEAYIATQLLVYVMLMSFLAGYKSKKELEVMLLEKPQ
ncbi:MAG: hypothetical protein HOI53_02795 [Francisellaceae bacterium]|nr:hypothetical protein [Francisellaceae bacterium]